jgi:hypothetical protein
MWKNQCREDRSCPPHAKKLIAKEAFDERRRTETRLSEELAKNPIPWMIENGLHVETNAVNCTCSSTIIDTLETKMPLIFVQSMAIFVPDCILCSRCG